MGNYASEHGDVGAARKYWITSATCQGLYKSGMSYYNEGDESLALKYLWRAVADDRYGHEAEFKLSAAAIATIVLYSKDKQIQSYRVAKAVLEILLKDDGNNAAYNYHYGIAMWFDEDGWRSDKKIAVQHFRRAASYGHKPSASFLNEHKEEIDELFNPPDPKRVTGYAY